MFFVLEISRPILWKPFIFKAKGVTTLRIGWLIFAISLHPMRYDEMIELAFTNTVDWQKGRIDNGKISY